MSADSIAASNSGGLGHSDREEGFDVREGQHTTMLAFWGRICGRVEVGENAVGKWVVGLSVLQAVTVW
jgi:hypothetical protein